MPRKPALSLDPLDFPLIFRPDLIVSFTVRSGGPVRVAADPSQALNFGGGSPKAAGSSVPLFFQEAEVGGWGWVL